MQKLSQNLKQNLKPNPNLNPKPNSKKNKKAKEKKHTTNNNKQTKNEDLQNPLLSASSERQPNQPSLTVIHCYSSLGWIVCHFRMIRVSEIWLKLLILSDKWDLVYGKNTICVRSNPGIALPKADLHGTIFRMQPSYDTKKKPSDF